ncbi:MAG: hypothetical protein ACI8PB_005415, partial [Desulforhopalus sp.]
VCDLQVTASGRNAANVNFTKNRLKPCQGKNACKSEFFAE